MSLASGQSKNKPKLSWKYSCYDKDTHISSNNQAIGEVVKALLLGADVPRVFPGLLLISLPSASTFLVTQRYSIPHSTQAGRLGSILLDLSL